MQGIKVMTESIPNDLKGYPHWVNWKLETRDGKLTKIPINPKTGGNAQSNRPETWGTFQEAEMFLGSQKDNRVAGVGFVFSEKDPFCGIDLDKCRNAEDGKIDQWAAEIVAEMKSYTEVTPSDTGLHILIQGNLSPGKRVKGGFGIDGKGKIEIYNLGRYFTVTGKHLEGTPTTVEVREDEMKELHLKIFGSPSVKSAPTSQANENNDIFDSDLLHKAKHAANGFKFSKLWSGDWAGYPSQSEADLSLCTMLAFWTGRDMKRMDRLFRQSGLMRGKWNERRGDKTYGEKTIQHAIEQETRAYSPSNIISSQGSAQDSFKPSTLQVAAGTIEIVSNLTDLGNARRLVLQHGADIHFCYPWKKWLVWEDSRWKIDNSGEVERRAKNTIGLILKEASETQDGNRRKDLAKHALKSESDCRIKAMIELAKSEPGISILPDEMDLDPWSLNVKNGTVNLRTGEMRPHDRRDKITKMAPVEFHPGVECLLWIEHLRRIFAGNDQMISFLQLALGYSITGVTDERVLFISHGSGANGKTTTHEVIAQILGDYATRTPTESILVKREGSIPNDVAKLKGTRFVFCSEAEEGKRLAESMIKDLTGGDTISARFMRGEWFEFKPTFKIWLATNHKPIIRGTDNAIWDRIRLIPYIVSIPPGERVPQSRMMEKLTPELPGILSWLVHGCLDWRRYGLEAPQEVKEATSEYRGDMDTLGGFMHECCTLSQKYEVSAKELYDAYVKWADGNGEHPVSQRMFGSRLRDRGFIKERMTGGRLKWIGIGLLVNEVNDSEPIFRISNKNSPS
jgi:putative DNA primase/helicase